MTDLSTFNPTSFDQLFNAFVEEGSAAINGNVADIKAVPAHLKTLAKAALKTAQALAEGRIDKETAGDALQAQKDAFKQALEFEAFMALVVAQKLTDAVFRVIGAAIRNRTGINLIPGG
jgi:hypothetical protein